jgi:hypothetical protein
MTTSPNRSVGTGFAAKGWVWLGGFFERSEVVWVVRVKIALFCRAV